jgi:hypothetical protein
MIVLRYVLLCVEIYLQEEIEAGLLEGIAELSDPEVLHDILYREETLAFQLRHGVSATTRYRQQLYKLDRVGQLVWLEDLSGGARVVRYRAEMPAHLLYIELKLLETGLGSEKVDGVLAVRVSDLVQNHALVVFQNYAIAVHEVSQERYQSSLLWCFNCYIISQLAHFLNNWSKTK